MAQFLRPYICNETAGMPRDYTPLLVKGTLESVSHI